MRDNRGSARLLNLSGGSIICSQSRCSVEKDCTTHQIVAKLITTYFMTIYEISTIGCS